MKYFLFFALVFCIQGCVEDKKVNWYLERTDGTIEQCNLYYTIIDNAIDKRTNCIPRQDIYSSSFYFSSISNIVNSETWKQFYRVEEKEDNVYLKKVYQICEHDNEKKWLDNLPSKENLKKENEKEQNPLN